MNGIASRRAISATPPGWGNGHTLRPFVEHRRVYRTVRTQHEILQGVTQHFHVSSWLYHVLPDYPPADATVLLIGKAVNPDKQSAIPNPVAWIWKTRRRKILHDNTRTS